MFQTSQWTWSSVPRLRATSGSRMCNTKLCVPGGTFIQVRAGDTCSPAWALRRDRVAVGEGRRRQAMAGGRISPPTAGWARCLAGGREGQSQEHGQGRCIESASHIGKAYGIPTRRMERTRLDLRRMWGTRQARAHARHRTIAAEPHARALHGQGHGADRRSGAAAATCSAISSAPSPSCWITRC